MTMMLHLYVQDILCIIQISLLFVTITLEFQCSKSWKNSGRDGDLWQYARNPWQWSKDTKHKRKKNKSQSPTITTHPFIHSSISELRYNQATGAPNAFRSIVQSVWRQLRGGKRIQLEIRMQASCSTYFTLVSNFAHILTTHFLAI